MAMKESFSSVAASAATTTFGFAALGFMQFRIGADLGITLVKGIVFSFLCVMVFLPAFTLVARKLVDKSQHRRFMPTFANIGRGLKPLRIPVFALVILLILPCTLAQGSTLFTYGMGSSEGSPTRTARDAEAIEAVYGKETPLVILVPNASMGEEARLVREIEAIPQVTSVLSYTTAVGAGIPAGFLDESVVSQFKSDDYTRIVAYTDMPREGDESFGVVNEIRALANSVCGEGVLVAGEPANLYDMKVVTASDSRITNAIAILAILIVLLATFRSVLLPIVLIATIESAIMINLSVPYFTGDSLNYLGFLVINTVQLGATVDYAILFTDTYRRYRKSMPVNEALFKTCGSTFKSILVSASILALAGCVLWLTSTNNIVSILGLLLFRGTLLSLFLVVTFLPAALRIFDKLIAKTTWRADFYEPPRSAAVIDKELP